MKKLHIITIAIMLLLVSTASAQEPFWLGADISGTTELEARGVKLYNQQGQIRENTALMKELGLNAVRLRVWVNPRGGFSNKEDVLEMAKRAKYYDMALMIDFHYSDWWADPGKQPIPAAWQYFSYDEMKYALAEHTRETLQLLKDHHIDVRWVQVGNETTHGFLWPMGRAEENMQQYAGLTEAGYQAVKSVYPKADVIIHLYHTVLELVRRLEKNDFEGRTLTLKVKFEDFQQITRSITVDHILRTKDDILPLAKQLMHSVEYHSHPIRLIGLGVSNQKGTTYQAQPRWIQLELEFKD